MLRFYGVPNRTTRIDYSPATNPPVWNPLSLGVSDANGIYEYEDFPPAGIDARLYRAVYP
jgi:hypothetical protein